jgi:hypothetical protein
MVILLPGSPICYSPVFIVFSGARGLVVPPRQVSFLPQQPPEEKLEQKRKNIKKRKKKTK